MGFGLSFGAKKSKGSSTTNVNKTTDTTQVESGVKSSTGVTSSTGTSTTTGTSTGQTTNQSTSTGSQTNQQQSTLFSQGILSGLEGIVNDLFGSQARTPMSLGSTFDKQSFVDSAYAAASNKVNSELDTGINAIYDTVGGRDDQNSMVTLLKNRAEGDAAANLAGVRANLTSQAEEIARANFGADLAAQGQSQGFLNNLLQQLKGGTANTSGAIQTAENQSQTGTSAQQTSEATQQQQTTTQMLLELLANAMAGTEHVVGTEKTKSKGTDMGGGFSLGI